ncbi:hypothetical protein GJAV_G00213840 [Gymnothorax javanicus]|nr:hypothetical protein GJAV_G00213840 [Gymnothorax javanicus]
MADYSAGRQGNEIPSGKGASTADLLLHPELLSREFIQLVLHEKRIEVEDHREASRDQLTDLYLQHVIPLPQRELPNSRWGRRVEQHRPRPTKGRAYGSSHSSSSSGSENARKRPLIVFDGSSTKTGTIKLKKPDFGSGTDRLKPPPSMSLANPIRKLSGSSSSPARTPVTPPGSSNRSPAGNGSPGSPMSPQSGSGAATVRLKRQATREGECDSSQGGLKSPEVKKKIQHVTWP